MGCTGALRKLQAVAALVLAPIGMASLAACDTLVYGVTEDTTWNINGSPYLLQGSTGRCGVAEGVTLTIKAGVKVKAPAGFTFGVGGSLVTQGSKANPVRFTSDGSTSPGHWKGIEFGAGSFGDVTGCVIEYAGGGGYWDCAAVRIKEVSQPAISFTDTVIRRSAAQGIYCRQNIPAAVRLKGCTIRECAQYPVACTFGSGPKFVGDGNRLVDNGFDAICAGFPPAGGGVVWHKAPVPYTWDGSADVDIDGNLVISPGAVVAPRSSDPQDPSELRVLGTLSAAGATFTSWREFAGQTPQPGDWDGIRFLPHWDAATQKMVGARGNLQSCELGYAGGDGAVDCQGVKHVEIVGCTISHTKSAGVFVDTCRKVYVFDTTFSDIGGRGLSIYGKGSNAVAAGCRFSNCGAGAVGIGYGAGANLGNLANLNTQDDGGNSFEDRGRIQVANFSAKSIKAENNYWGYTTWKDIDRKAVYDRRDDPSAGPVDFTPFLSASPASAVAGAQVMSLAAMPSAAGGAEVSFALSAPATVDVTILNLAGRLIRRVCTGRELAQGLQAVLWDGRSATGTRAPRGAYVVRVAARSADGTQTQGVAVCRLAR